MENIAALSLLLALLTGCAAHDESSWDFTPGQYQSFHELMVHELTERLGIERIPHDVKVRLTACFTDYLIADIPPTELVNLDAVIRGDPGADENEATDTLRRAGDALQKSQPEDLSVLEPYCPDDIPTFKQYVRQ